MSWLAIMFAIVAVIYASVGFGGGSTYTALLALVETDYQLLPIVSLTCNLLVVTGGTILFSRAGSIPWPRALPLCALSIPLAWLGGRTSVPQSLFVGLLALSLLVSGLLLLIDHRQRPRAQPLSNDLKSITINQRPWHQPVEILIGAGIGFLSGLVGIGGGIFLSPILFLLHWSSARAIAGTASLFILVNSLAGMMGQLQKLGSERAGHVFSYWPLFLAVLVGGQLGTRLGVNILPERWMKRVTATLVLFVALRLFQRLYIQLSAG